MKKRAFLIAGAVCALLCVLLLIKALPGRRAPVEIIEPTVTDPEPAEPDPPEEPPYESPVDFAAWQEKNPDVYAWLSIPGTQISYPVVQHPAQDEYYLNHSAEGAWAAAGALFTQATYNSLTFEDPVTVIYGHRQNDGSMFGDLQPLYLGDADFSQINEIVIFLPEGERHYQIFAAVPHSNEHILYAYDFSREESYQRFLDSVYGCTDYAANFDMSAAADTGDRLLILSTCLKTNRTNRFLVIGKLVETIPAEKEE